MVKTRRRKGMTDDVSINKHFGGRRLGCGWACLPGWAAAAAVAAAWFVCT